MPVTFVSPLTSLLSVGHYGRGRVYDEPLRVLRDLTRQVRKECPGCIVLWVVHFEPESAKGGLELLNDQALVQAATQEQVPAILCGHTHRSLVKPVGGGTTEVFVCGTTTQYFVQPPDTKCLHILQIDTAAVPFTPPTISCVRYNFNPVKKGFFRDPNFP
jgi:hypothetical protein